MMSSRIAAMRRKIFPALGIGLLACLDGCRTLPPNFQGVFWESTAEFIESPSCSQENEKLSVYGPCEYEVSFVTKPEELSLYADHYKQCFRPNIGAKLWINEKGQWTEAEVDRIDQIFCNGFTQFFPILGFKGREEAYRFAFEPLAFSRLQPKLKKLQRLSPRSNQGDFERLDFKTAQKVLNLFFLDSRSPLKKKERMDAIKGTKTWIDAQKNGFFEQSLEADFDSENGTLYRNDFSISASSTMSFYFVTLYQSYQQCETYYYFRGKFGVVDADVNSEIVVWTRHGPVVNLSTCDTESWTLFDGTGTTGLSERRYAWKNCY